jgi:cation diffusion facilitator family transporter
MAESLQETLLPQNDPLTLSTQSKKNSLKKLVVVSVVCLIFMSVEIIGGIISNSLAIMTDAAHLLSDNVSFAIAIISIIIANKPASNEMSYGYHRAEIIGAMLSVAMIWGLTIWIVYEAFIRIFNPEKIDGGIMLMTAVFGLICNRIMAKVLHHSHGAHGHDHSHGAHSHDHSHEGHSHDHHSHGSHLEDVNVRAAFLHVLGDMIQSIGVIIASVVIYFFPDWSIADTICSFLFSILVICTTYSITKECIGVLMEASPVGIDIEKLNDDLLDVRFM